VKDNWLKPLKLRALKAMPGLYAELQARVWSRRYQPLHQAAWRCSGGRIAGGPFTGMWYLQRAAGSLLVPKLMGSYEAELHGIIEEHVIRQDYSVIVDVGCAEGYYAVGLALRLPQAAVLAYDTDQESRALCRQLATINGINDRIVIGGTCEPQDLLALAGRPALVISDCEGYEQQLFDADIVSALRSADLLIELHEFLVPGVTESLLRRFAATHDVMVIPVAARRPEQFPAIAALTPHWRRRAMEEGRPPSQHWLWARRRASN
jgi:hypothetical protein